MAEQPTPQPTPQPGVLGSALASELVVHDTIAEVLATLRSAPRHRDDMQSEVYAKLSEADLATVITRLEQVAHQSQQKALEPKKP